VLSIACAPVTWPIGMGRELKGIYHLLEDRIYAYAGGRAAAWREPRIDGLASAEARSSSATCARRSRGDRAVAARPAVRAGAYSPAPDAGVLRLGHHNFGVEELLGSFVRCTRRAARGARRARGRAAGETLTASCSRSRRTWTRAPRPHRVHAHLLGPYRRGMRLHHVGSARRCASRRAHLHGRGPPAGDEAFAGDIIGLHNHGTINIGDTFTEGETLSFTGIPNFAPELFRRAC
jgi:peptide chain release factor 3